MLKEKLAERRFSPRSNGRKGAEEGPAPAYSLVSEKLRRSSSGSVQCSLFCGGHNCKYETPLHWGSEDKAVKGLFSHWITENTLAMARPSTFLFTVFDIVGQFKSLGVCSVINLQCTWEHAKCGPGLESSGFSYCPQDLMKEGVYYYNFGWSDYSVPSLDSLLDVVKVLDYALTVGKVAVHCHAGLGRTGVLIACHMIYSTRVSGSQAIAHVRSKRPGSIQTRSQIDIVKRFALHLSTLWTFHPTLEFLSDKRSEVTSSNSSLDLHSDKRSKVTQYNNVGSLSSRESVGLGDGEECPTMGLSYDDLLRNQAQVLHGQEQVDLKHIPKFIHEVCERLGDRSYDPTCDIILHHSVDEHCQIFPSILNSLQVCCHDNSLDETILPSIRAIQTQVNCTLDWNLLHRERDPRVLLGLLSTFFSALKDPFLSQQHISSLETTHQLYSLPNSRTAVISRLLAALTSMVTRQLHCDRQECLVSILTELCLRLSSMFVQRNCSGHIITTITDVLVGHMKKDGLLQLQT